MESKRHFYHNSSSAQNGEPVKNHSHDSGEEKPIFQGTWAEAATPPPNWKEWLVAGTQTVLKALVVCQDEQDSSAIMSTAQKCGVEASVVSDGIQAVARMRQRQFDLIFADIQAPEMEGFKLLKTAREINPEAEIFVIAPYGKLENAVECAKRGAEGFIIKPDIASQVAVAVGKVKDRKQSRRLAYTDRLTSLFNHATFQHFLQQECHRSESHGHSFGLLLLDIDHFKLYNDLNGHLLGDIALIKLGKLLKDSIRASDIPARYGGDEFAIILTETSFKESIARANRIRQLVALAQFQHEKSMPEKKLTVSIGLALHPEHGPSHHEILKSVEHALNQAKARGGNKTCVYGESEDEDEITADPTTPQS